MFVVDKEDTVDVSGGKNSDGAAESVLREDGDGWYANVDHLVSDLSQELEYRRREGGKRRISDKQAQVFAGGDAYQATVMSSDRHAREALAIHQAQGIDNCRSLRNGLNRMSTDVERFNRLLHHRFELAHVLIQEVDDRRLRDDVHQFTICRQDGHSMKASRQQFNSSKQASVRFQGRESVSSRQVRHRYPISCRRLKHVYTMQYDILQRVVVHYLLLVVHKSDK